MLLAMKTRNQQLVRFDSSIVTVKQWSIVRDCAIIIWRGGSKINRGGLNLNQSAG